MTRFDGRTILVTGATGGIGEATVRRLIDDGANVIAAGRAQDVLDRIADTTGARTLRFDLTSEDEIRDAVSGLSLWGVVNCAGFGGEIATPITTDISVFDKVINVNARGSLLVIKYVAPAMIESGGGSIVNVSSQASLVALPGHVSYGFVEGRSGQHHPCRCPGTRPAQHSGQQCQPDGRDDRDVGVLLGPARDRRPLPRADAAAALGHRRRDRRSHRILAQR